ncbi:hypothetical protein SLE2022_316580 [Rubroshorea leprosula]
MLILFLIVLFFHVGFFEARQLASSKAKLNALPKVLETPCHASGRAIAGNGRFSTGLHGAFFNRNLESVPSPKTGN